MDCEEGREGRKRTRHRSEDQIVAYSFSQESTKEIQKTLSVSPPLRFPCSCIRTRSQRQLSITIPTYL
jgi:hypothetical protein